MSDERVRLDKWLWAARFFRTRSMAKDAIDGGKVHYNGTRCKVSKDVEIGATLQIRQGQDEKTVVVKALSVQRRGAPEAQLLYEETSDSVAEREKLGQQRRLTQDMMQPPAGRPDKRDRRHIHQFKERALNDTWRDE
jgi:ribosome-associated heat shock protein Hsp15